MGMMLLRIKSILKVSKLSHYPIPFTSSSQKFIDTQEDNDQAFPVAL
ncbi:MAG: hypothetical protein ACJ76H_03350 [Bacteriovoracaceae bacterium]